MIAGMMRPAAAQPYPSRPLRIISPFAAGGSNDVIARIIAQKLAASLGQQFIVANRAGAGGVVGPEIGARAAADGYTLPMISVATLAISPALAPTPYDPIKDFAPVGLTGVSPSLVLVNPAVP